MTHFCDQISLSVTILLVNFFTVAFYGALYYCVCTLISDPQLSIKVKIYKKKYFTYIRWAFISSQSRINFSSVKLILSFHSLIRSDSISIWFLIAAAESFIAFPMCCCFIFCVCMCVDYGCVFDKMYNLGFKLALCFRYNSPFVICAEFSHLSPMRDDGNKQQVNNAIAAISK